MSLDFYPLIRQFLDRLPRAAITIGTDGLPVFRDWMVRGQFATWLRNQGHEVDEADIPPPGPRAAVILRPHGSAAMVPAGFDPAAGADASTYYIREGGITRPATPAEIRTREGLPPPVAPTE